MPLILRSSLFLLLLLAGGSFLGAQNLPAQAFSFRWKAVDGAGGYLAEVKGPSGSLVESQQVGPDENSMTLKLIPGPYSLRLTTLNRFLTAESSTDWVPIHVAAPSAPEVGDFAAQTLRPGQPGTVKVPAKGLAVDATAALQSPTGTVIPLAAADPSDGILTLTLPPLTARGNYTLILTNPPKLTTTVTGKLSVHYAAPVISELTPTGLETKDAGQQVDIKGSGFSPETVVTLKAGPTGSALSLLVANANSSVLTAVIPPGLPPGDYLLSVANARDEEAVPAGTLTLKAPPPPPVVEVLPPPEPEPKGPPGDPKVAVSTFAVSDRGEFSGPLGIAHKNSGSIFVSDTNGNIIRAVYPNGEITKVAGSGQPGASNGKGGDSAQFKRPTGLAVDSHDNVLVADSGNGLLRKITPEGEVSNVVEIPNPSRTFGPQGLAIDAVDNLYIADSANNVILTVTAAGKISVLAGTGKLGAQNGPLNKASFSGPQGIAVNASGIIFVADTGNNLIRRITPDGLVSTLAGSGDEGTNDGKGEAAQFNQPTGIVVAPGNVLYVSEGFGQRVRRVASDGTVTTVAGSGRSGSADGPGDKASFRFPGALTLADDGALLLVDSRNNSVRKVVLPTETAAESQFAVSTWAGNGVATFKNSYGPLAGFNGPNGLALDEAGTLYVADTGNHSIRKVTADGTVTTLSGTGKPGSSNGSIFFWDQPSYNRPTGLAVGPDGSVYVADAGNNLIRKITPKGEASTFAGNGKYWYANGQGDKASFAGPSAMTVDPYGSVYVVEDGGSGRIRKITPEGVVTSVVATWAPETIKLVNPKTDFSPGGLVADGAGNLYVSTKVSPRLLKITPDGQIHILAGSGTPGGQDGKGTQASFQASGALALDHFGNVYVADTLNHAVRRVTLGGTVTTILPPRDDPWRYPNGIAVAADGSLLVADTGNHRISKVDLVAQAPDLGLTLSNVANQGNLTFPGAVTSDPAGNLYLIDGNSIVKMTPSGAVTLVAGSGREGNSDGQGAAASFRRPQALALDDAGNLYVADTGNNALRFVSKDGTVTTLSKALHRPQGLTINKRGRVFVADTDAQTILEFTGNDVIRGIKTKKAFVPVASALVSPRALVADIWGNLLVIDGNRLKRIDTQGKILSLAGSGSTGTLDGWGKNASFSTPTALTVDKEGNAYVVDQGYGHLRRVNPAGVVDTIDTIFDLPVGVTVDPQGRIWVTDGLRQKVQVLVPASAPPLKSLVAVPPAEAGVQAPAGRTINFGAGLAAWAGIKPALQMASPLIVWPAIPGSSPRAIYFAHDDKYFYWLMTLADGRPRGSNSINYALEIFQSPGGSQLTAKIDGWSHYIQPALIFGASGGRQWRDVWRGGDTDRTVGEGYVEARFPLEQMKKYFTSGEDYQILVHVYRAAAEVPFREGPRLGWSSLTF